MVVVDAHNVIPITRPKAFEAPVRKAMIHVVALVIGAVVSIPAIIADVRGCIHVALFARFALWLRIARVALAGEAECDRDLRAVGYALGLEIPPGAVAARGAWGAKHGAARRVRTIRILREVVFIPCLQVLHVAFCPSSALRSPSMFAYFSSCLSKPGCFVGSGTACGKNCSCHIGVPAKKASAIKMPKGFLLLTAPGFEECVGSLIFMGFFLSGLRRVVKPKSCKSFYFICPQWPP